MITTRSSLPGLGSAAARGWWLFVVRGVLALLLGLVAIFEPRATLAAVILLLGAFFVVDGLFAVVKAVGVMRSDAAWWLLLLSGFVSIAAGWAILRWPGLTALTLGYLVGFWALLTGVFEIVVAVALRRVITGEWLYVLFGVISVAFGIYVTLVPGLGLTYLTILIAIYGFTAGSALIAAGLRLKRLTK